jgi:hypothetical protein
MKFKCLFILSDGGEGGATGFKSAVVKRKDYLNRTIPLQNCGKTGKLMEVDDILCAIFLILHEVNDIL